MMTTQALMKTATKTTTTARMRTRALSGSPGQLRDPVAAVAPPQAQAHWQQQLSQQLRLLVRLGQ
jgi:hypothetical protein